MSMTVKIGNKPVGKGRPCYVIGEIGINHNGDLSIAQKLIEVAAKAGCDAVKFQKRTPELSVPAEQRSVMRETPWGTMTYLDYRYKVEFGEPEYRAIDALCRSLKIHWFASPWDEPSVEFLEKFDPLTFKVASASLTDDPLLLQIKRTGRPVILSSGMSTMDQIEKGVGQFPAERLLLAHTTSAYPCEPDELNLRMIQTLQRRFESPIGYSGHERGLQTTVAAVAMGATFIERHITLDRAMWGSDQAASVEPQGLERLVRDIRVVERAIGDGVKKVYDSEIPILKRLRRK